MRPDIGVTVAGRYRLEHPLAAGGMGSVWVATHLGLDAKVAVKFMSDEVALASTGRARFEREAKAAARLTSPHVVRATDYGVEDNTPFIVMELLTGESLEARLKRAVRISPQEASSVVRQVAKGLAVAHANGIIHRDLKPANIFLAQVGDEELAKVLDFGIAKETNKLLVQDDDTKSGTLLGSPQHMSPEQARGGEIDARSDLWSLGVVAFRAITGHRPFAGTNMADIVAKICIDPIPKPSALVPELGTRFDAFFEKAFARNPAFRFQAARELADAFSDAAGTKEDGDVISLRAVPPPTDVAPRGESTAHFAARASSVDTVELTQNGTTQDQILTEVSPRSRPGGGRLALIAAVVGVIAVALVYAAMQLPPTSDGAAAGPADQAGGPAPPASVVTAPATGGAVPSAAASLVAPGSAAPTSLPSATSVQTANPRRPPLPGRPSGQPPKRQSDPFF